ncbi:MAG: histidine phosphatase family protein [bacterium]
MLLILARHGNTFNKGEKIYRVGNANDLPLVEKGLEQAQTFAKVLLEKNIKPVAVYCGPLQRTRKFAEIIVSGLDLHESPIVDERLNELNYGVWAGLDDEAIREKVGADFDGWEKHGRWPQNSKWPETEKEVVHQVRSFAKSLAEKYNPEDVVIVVSSSGKLRYFLKLIENEFEDRIKSGNIKVGTGNACIVAYDRSKFELVAWNINVVEL